MGVADPENDNLLSAPFWERKLAEKNSWVCHEAPGVKEDREQIGCSERRT
jgi:hypothetical protein